LGPQLVRLILRSYIPLTLTYMIGDLTASLYSARYLRLTGCGGAGTVNLRGSCPVFGF